MMSKQLSLKSRVYAFYDLHKEKGKAFIWKHFKIEGAARSTINRLIKHAEQGKSITRKKGGGPKSEYNTSTNRTKLKRMFDNKKGVSLRKASKKLKCSHQTISRYLNTYFIHHIV